MYHFSYNVCIQTMNVFINVIYQSTSRILQATELCLLLSLSLGLLFVLEGNNL